ncbi:MAG: dipeptidase [Thermomicrobiales bacterium]
MGNATGTTTIPIFDGHNDTVLNLESTGRSFFEQATNGHVDLPRAAGGGLAGGFFAVFVPDPSVKLPDSPDQAAATAIAAYGGGAKLPEPMSTAYAQSRALELVGRLYRLERESDGRVEIVRTATELREAIARGVFAVEIHFEGAEAIDPDLRSLEAFYAMGLRSIGLVWSRSNLFGHGVPFKFPSSPDTGPGLTDAGKALVHACNELGILIDVSHLNEAGFWDVARLSDAPLVATHSCAHALCPAARNLTDTQLDAIRDSEGIVGVNFHVGFLREDGGRDAQTTSLSLIADHLDYLVERLGEDKVAFGSDFDGAIMPGDLGDCAGLPALVDLLRTRGYDDATLRKFGFENWLRVFERTWKN